MSRYLTQHVGTRQTPQSEKIPGSTQVANSAGGFAWAVDNWMRLDRFLVLGSEGGTYYVGERELTVQNAEAVLRCVKADGVRVVNRVVEISEAGRAPKNDPALFMLALASKHGDESTRKAAFAALPKVARIGTHLFHFLDYRQAFGGWGRGMRQAVDRWYTSKSADHLAMQLVKYRQRDGWTHRDVLRKSHPKAQDPEVGALLAWAAGKGEPMHRLAQAFAEVQAATTPAQVVALITEHNLPREAVPTEMLVHPEVWDVLLHAGDGMPLTAMIRNLATMTRIGLLKPLSRAAGTVVAALADAERIRKTRVHPIAVLAALLTYASGRGIRGSATWTPVPQIIDALDAAFYTAFGNVQPTNKRILLALDVSGSMSMGEIAAVPGLSPRVGAAAMALVTAATEPNYAIMAFADRFIPLPVSLRQRLDDVVNTTAQLPFMRTDCALPMLWALQNGIKVDAFLVYTDSETWAGSVHPSQALAEYRRKTGIAAKLVVIGMVSNGFSIADPDDAGMMDVVGFDTATPNVIADFVRT